MCMGTMKVIDPIDDFYTSITLDSDLADKLRRKYFYLKNGKYFRRK